MIRIPAAADDILAGRLDDAASNGIPRITARLRGQVILTFVHDDDLADEGQVAAELRRAVTRSAQGARASTAR